VGVGVGVGVGGGKGHKGVIQAVLHKYHTPPIKTLGGKLILYTKPRQAHIQGVATSYITNRGYTK